MLTRRQFLATSGTVLAAGAAVGLYTWRIEPHWPEVVRRPMFLPHLPPALAGRTLLQLSDLHVGPRVDSGYLIETLQEARRLAPDIVAFTGDFISYRSSAQFDELASVLAHAPRGRLATVASLGNHDYGMGWRETAVADSVEAVVRGAGATVLRNATVEIDELQLTGLGDYWSPDFGAVRPVALLLTDPPAPAGVPVRPTVRATLDALHRGKPSIVLSHNPDTLDEPIWGDLQCRVLAGHTHGGQCKPPFLPPPLLPVRNRRYTAGEIDVAPGRSVYINRGLGYLYRVRFNARPEMTLFTLEPAVV